jgi:transcriptional regulator with XRE-family HTH domain
VAGQPAPEFAGLLQQLRAEAGLTQEELAQAAGLSPRTVSDLELWNAATHGQIAMLRDARDRLLDRVQP